MPRSGKTRKKKGDAMNPLFQRYYADLLKWCRRHCPRAWGEPEDFVHDAYLRCRRNWRAENATAREAAYFYRALRWVVADAVRKSRRRHAGDAQLAAVAAGPSFTTAAPAMQEALQLLTPREQAICAGRLRGESEQETCARLGLSRIAHATHLSRARHKLCDNFGVTPRARGKSTRARSAGAVN
jgi:RNA polymerase sigma factor (sigma-70 family)